MAHRFEIRKNQEGRIGFVFHQQFGNDLVD